MKEERKVHKSVYRKGREKDFKRRERVFWKKEYRGYCVLLLIMLSASKLF
jgi:hypothetical protein